MATILCIDDNTSLLTLLQERFRRLGYDALTAKNGAEGLRIFSHRVIDLAIVDYYMPGMGGDTVALEMKRQRPEVPIIIYSGALTLPELVMAYVDGFISTGDDTEDLIHKVTELLAPPPLQKMVS